jgi:hypothetical protein
MSLQPSKQLPLMTTSFFTFCLNAIAYNLFQIISLQIIALAGATTGFGYKSTQYGYGPYGNIPTS